MPTETWIGIHDWLDHLREGRNFIHVLAVLGALVAAHADLENESLPMASRTALSTCIGNRRGWRASRRTHRCGYWSWADRNSLSSQPCPQWTMTPSKPAAIMKLAQVANSLDHGVDHGLIHAGDLGAGFVHAADRPNRGP